MDTRSDLNAPAIRHSGVSSLAPKWDAGLSAQFDLLSIGSPEDNPAPTLPLWALLPR